MSKPWKRTPKSPKHLHGTWGRPAWRGPVSQRARVRGAERKGFAPLLPALQWILFFCTLTIRGGGTASICLKFMLKTVTREHQESVMSPGPRFQRMGTKGPQYLRWQEVKDSGCRERSFTGFWRDRAIPSKGAGKQQEKSGSDHICKQWWWKMRLEG